MFGKQPLFNYEFTVFETIFIIGASLKRFSQKTSYSIFDKPFIPIQ